MQPLSTALRSIQERARLAQAGSEARLDESQQALLYAEWTTPEPAQKAAPKHRDERLAPVRHVNRDFFVADIFSWSPKDDLDSMEHPLFALRAGDTRVRTYERNGTSVMVLPGHYGCASIHDKDVWIYCISQLVEAINRGRGDINRTVRFIGHDFLVATNRASSGRASRREYDRMQEALDRLKGTVIKTNIKTGGSAAKVKGFGLIETYEVIRRDHDGRMESVEVTLPDWLFRSVQACEVLTLNRDYFRLRKPLDRRIYELVRKHCGSQPRWRVGIDTLYQKSGSVDRLPKFRDAMKKFALSNHLPDYRVMADWDADALTFYARAPKGHSALVQDILSKHGKPQPARS